MRNHSLLHGTILVTVLLAAALGRGVGAAGAEEAPGARIRAVERGLLPPVLIQGEKVPGMNLQARMQRWKVPGVSIAVVDGGAVTWARAYGVVEAGKTDSVTVETLFQAGSVSKPVAAMTALRLVESGRLKLDEDVNRWLVSWKIPSSDASKDTVITLRMLLTHSAGLTVHGFPGYTPGDSIPSLVQVLDGAPPANTPAVRVDTRPGKTFRYSGGGFCVVQQLLVDVTGDPYPEIVAAAVLRPLGMAHSSFEQTDASAAGRGRAAGHSRDASVIAGMWHRYPELAAAGLWSTPSDLAQLLLDVQAAWRGSSHRVLSAAMTQTMLTPQITPTQGLGWRLEGKGPSARFEHGGETDGFACFVVGYLERGQGAAVMTNGDRGSALVQEILRAIAKEYGWVDYLPQEKKVITVPQESLARHLGRYALDIAPNIFVEFSMSGDSLFVTVTQPSGTERGHVLAESFEHFFDPDSGVEFIFGPEVGNHTGSLVILQGEEEYRATPVP